jgi:hypothetical protein
VSCDPGGAPAGGGWRGRLFPQPPRRFPGARAWQVGARTAHIAAMALVVGGVAAGRSGSDLALPIALTVASGLALLGIDLYKSGRILVEGAGLATLLKLAVLGAGLLLPPIRLEAHLVAVAIASVGSHMPKTWRHWSPRR